MKIKSCIMLDSRWRTLTQSFCLKNPQRIAQNWAPQVKIWWKWCNPRFGNIFCPPRYLCIANAEEQSRSRRRKLKLPRKAHREREPRDANAESKEQKLSRTQEERREEEIATSPQLLVLLCERDDVTVNAKKEKGKPSRTREVKRRREEQ